MAINDQLLSTLINSPDFGPRTDGGGLLVRSVYSTEKKNEELEHLASQPRERIKAVEGKVKQLKKGIRE